MLGVFAFPALLPTFVSAWALTKTEAGWIAGIYFAAYALAAPLLLANTDRHDARKIHLGGSFVAAISSVGFALFAEGFWTAMLFRAMAGAGLAATYMPGLRVLVDRYRAPKPSRAISFYTSSFSLGAATSYLAAGGLATAFGWRTAFASAAVAAMVAFFIVLALPPARPDPRAGDHADGDRSTGGTAGRSGSLFALAPVLRNRVAVGYILAYGAHCWELFTLRSWLVAFLTVGAALSASETARTLSPTAVATLSGLVAMAASIGGNELALRFGRTRAIAWTMAASSVAAAGIGFAGGLPYGLVAILALAYTGLVQLDSASLTAGVVAASGPGRQGATLALHALFGFACAGIGPIVFGRVLDATGGGEAISSWGIAFAVTAFVAAAGLPALRLTRRGDDT
jgi:Cyanate permease